MMNDRTAVIEQRLRCGGIAAALGGITFFFLLVSVIFLEASGNSSFVTVALVLEVIVLAGLIAAIVMFTRVVVRVFQTTNGRALEIVYGPRGSVRQVFAPEEVESAYARHLSLADMGGWGYRGSLRLRRRAALVTRPGDALDLALTRGRRFVVTVDNPADFVAALEKTSSRSPTPLI
jgi:hypothetical protein